LMARNLEWIAKIKSSVKLHLSWIKLFVLKIRPPFGLITAQKTRLKMRQPVIRHNQKLQWRSVKLKPKMCWPRWNLLVNHPTS